MTASSTAARAIMGLDECERAGVRGRTRATRTVQSDTSPGVSIFSAVSIVDDVARVSPAQLVPTRPFTLGVGQGLPRHVRCVRRSEDGAQVSALPSYVWMFHNVVTHARRGSEYDFETDASAHGPSAVTVRMLAAPINPADINQIEGAAGKQQSFVVAFFFFSSRRLQQGRTRRSPSCLPWAETRASARFSPWAQTCGPSSPGTGSYPPM